MNVERGYRLLIDLSGRNRSFPLHHERDTNSSLQNLGLITAERPFPDVVVSVGPPLSLMKNSNVFSSSFRSRTFARTLPTASSIAESIAANVLRFSSFICGNRSRYFLNDWQGRVHGVKGQIEKERLLMMSFDECLRFACKGIGQVFSFYHWLGTSEDGAAPCRCQRMHALLP